MKMSDNLTKYEVLIEQYLRSILVVIFLPMEDWWKQPFNP